MKKLTTQDQKEYDSLTTDERIVYDSIMRYFPATSHGSAFNKAIEGGCHFQYVYK